MVKKKDPKVGTGKKPKGSGRRLYTDENPKDTVKIKFATPADARATVAKVKKINKQKNVPNVFSRGILNLEERDYKIKLRLIALVFHVIFLLLPLERSKLGRLIP